MNKYELVYDLKEHLDTYSQTYDDYIMSYGEADMIYHYIEEKGKENERLNKENKILRENAEHNDKVVDKVNWENKRLNNIINKLEKWLDVNLFNLEKENANNTYDKGLKQGMLANGRLIKNKLQELKGSDKE